MNRNSFISGLSAIAFSLMYLPLAFGAPGDLDITHFNPPNGYFTYHSGNNDYIYATALQSDGKIVSVGLEDSGTTYYVLVMRLNSGGTLDNTFGSGGVATYSMGHDCFGYGVAIQEDGKIVVTGGCYMDTHYDVLVLRFNSNGTLDNAFGSGGIFTYDRGSYDFGFAVTIQLDGKIVVAGSTGDEINDDVLVLRLNSNGTLDSTFRAGDVFTYNRGSYDYGYAVVVQSDGKIVVTGSTGDDINDDVLVLRLNSNGTLDNTFGSGGIVIYNSGNDDYGYGVAIQADGKIVVTGGCYMDTHYDVLVLRFNSNGTLDNTFGSGGIFVYESVNSSYGVVTAVQSDGKIVVTGHSYNGANYDVLVLRLNSNDGALDSTFGIGGIVTYTGVNCDCYGYAVAIQPDGKIVVAGCKCDGTNCDVLVMRLIGVEPPPAEIVSISASIRTSAYAQPGATASNPINRDSGTITPPTYAQYNLTISYNVSNRTRLNSRASTLKFYFSNDPYLSGDDIYVGGENIPSLASGKSMAQSRIYKISLPTYRTSYVVAVMDNSIISTPVSSRSSIAPGAKK